MHLPLVGISWSLLEISAMNRLLVKFVFATFLILALATPSLTGNIQASQIDGSFEEHHLSQTSYSAGLADLKRLAYNLERYDTFTAGRIPEAEYESLIERYGRASDSSERTSLEKINDRGLDRFIPKLDEIFGGFVMSRYYKAVRED